MTRALDDNDCPVFNETQTTKITFSPKHSYKGLWWMVSMTAESKAVLTPPLSKKKKKNSGDGIFQKLLKFFLNDLGAP